MINLFKINILTYLLLILSFFSGYYKQISIIFIILIVHELGHFFLMKIYDIKVNKIILYPYGGMIKSNILINTNSLKILIISLGGIISQMILFFIMKVLFEINLLNQNIYNIFIFSNFSIIFFNLLPIYPLDGYKILNSIFELYFSFKKSLILSLIFNIITLTLFIIYLYKFKINNYIIVIFMFSSLFKYIKEIKYIFNKFYIERILYKIEYKGLISVNKLSNIHKNKFNYIRGISEKKRLKEKYGNF